MNVAERIEVIRELCSFEGRLAGTDAERRAANALARRLREHGREVEIEPTYVHPQWGLVYALHCMLGFAGSLVAVGLPALGFGLVLLAATSMYLDLNYRVYILRRLFFRRASQNVVSPGDAPNAPVCLVLCAHLDAGRAAAAFKPRRIARAARLQRSLGLPLGRFRPLFWSLALLLPPLGLRMAGVESNAISLLQLVPTLVLLVGMFALVEVELSPVAPAANDNASGVVAVLALAAELDANPPENLDVWVLLTGGEECQQEGMRAFLRAHRDELDSGTTYFVCVEAAGRGETIGFETAGGWAVTYAMERRLVELCAAIAEADREGDDRYAATPWRRGSAGDSLPPRLRGFGATTVTGLAEDGAVPDQHTLDDVTDRIEPESLERAHGFVLELVRALDRDVGRRVAAGELDGPAEEADAEPGEGMAAGDRDDEREPASTR